ncbi:MAG: hypothetical protein HOH04_15535 [Rhodospirillaceae bacterium]|nr:hypothetical protein [Rhodospirillaceae bacterium]
MRRTTLAIVSAMMALVIGAGTLDAKSVERKRSYGLREQGKGHIQMRSMIAPVKRKAKSRRVHNTPVTVILSVRDNSKVGKVCNKGPRISDALVRAWHKKPMVANYLYNRDTRGNTKIDYRRTPAQKAEDKRLINIVNRALGINEVVGILVLKGSMSMGGGAVTKLPFSSVNGCDELQEEKKKKKKK